MLVSLNIFILLFGLIVLLALGKKYTQKNTHNSNYINLVEFVNKAIHKSALRLSHYWNYFAIAHFLSYYVIFVICYFIQIIFEHFLNVTFTSNVLDKFWKYEWPVSLVSFINQILILWLSYTAVAMFNFLLPQTTMENHSPFKIGKIIYCVYCVECRFGANAIK